MTLTKEERLTRAREKAEKLRIVSKTRGRGADRMDWKPKSKIYLHPDSELYDRLRVWFPKETMEKDEKGKETGKKKVANTPYNVPKDPKACPFQTLRAILSERDNIDPDDIILSVGSGRGKVEFCKGDILNLDGYDYRRSLRPNADFVTAAIMISDSKGKRVDRLKIEVLSGAKTLAAEIRKEMDSEIDESGEEAGNPYFNPYPFIIEFHESERGSDMYTARARVQESPEGDDELTALLETEPPDLTDELKLSDPDEMLATLNAALVRDDIEIIIENQDEVFKKPSSSSKESSQKKAVKSVKKVEEVEEEEEAVEEEAVEEEAVEEEAVEEEAVEEEAVEEEAVEEEAVEEEAVEEEAVETKRRPAPKPAPKETSKPAPKPAPKETSKPAPSAKREKKVEGKKELGWTPAEGEAYDLCPKCNEAVPIDAEECPHTGCGAKYVVSSDEAF